MAAETGLTQNAIVRIWHAFGLQPHRVENFKFSKDPQFIEKVRDIVAVHEPTGSCHCVVRGTKRARWQVLNRKSRFCRWPPACPPGNHTITRGMGLRLCLRPRCGQRRDYQQLLPPARHQEFLRFLNDIDANLPGGFDVHLVMDNYDPTRGSVAKAARGGLILCDDATEPADTVQRATFRSQDHHPVCPLVPAVWVEFPEPGGDDGGA